MNYKQYIAEKLKIEGVSASELEAFIEIPPSPEVGDYALPCFKLAKIMRKSPIMIANDLAGGFMADEIISSCEAVNGYLNFRLNRLGFCKGTIENILKEGEAYGNSNEGEGKTICIDFSSINIAKPFHIGHLLTTVLGASLYKIYKALGYNVVGINHLGDYGTQFGKLIYAYKHWGSREAVEELGLEELTRLYVYYHEQAELHPEMDDEARAYFKAIEEGDKECNEIFEFFKKITLAQIDKIYKLLDVHFDSYAGESFYNDKMQVVIDELNEKGLLVESEGAKVVDLSNYNMPPCIILRSDGASLYATRDLAAAIYRKNTYNFDKCLYVVAYQQDLHFKQIFKTLELMGKPWYKDMVHVSYGMVSLEDGAMSTRKGKVVLLKDVINKTIEKATEIINAKNPNLENKEQTAVDVGTGAVIFGALSSGKIKDMVFSYDKVLNFDGETGPYCQYTVARCNSVLKKGENIDFSSYIVDNVDEDEYNLCVALKNLPEVIRSAALKYEPSMVTHYAVDVAKLFNKFYFSCKIISEDENLTKFRLAITKAAKTCLQKALALLGIKTPEKM